MWGGAELGESLGGAGRGLGRGAPIEVNELRLDGSSEPVKPYPAWLIGKSVRFLNCSLGGQR